MPETTRDDEMSPVIKYPIYILYLIIAPLLVINFVAARAVIPLKRNWSIARTIKGIVDSVAYLKFLTPPARRRIFVRSAIPTPAQYIDSIPGEKVLNGDTRVERQQSGEHWDRVRTATYKRDDYTCQICGITGGPDGEAVTLQADHIVPKSRGGEDDPDNLRTLCRTCHQARHARRF